MKKKIVMFNHPGIVCALAVLLVFSSSISAQGTRSTGRNFVAGGSFSVNDFERINLANGNLFLSFPLAQLPVGRSGLTSGIYLTYNSKLFNSEMAYFDNSYGPCLGVNWLNVGAFTEILNVRCGRYSKHTLTPSDEGGWQISLGYSIKVEERSSGFTQNDCYGEFQAIEQPGYNLMTYFYKTFIVFPDGSKHEMVPSGYSDAEGDRYYRVHPDGFQRSCTATSSVTRPTYYSVDGTYLRMQWVTNRWVLYFPDGSYFDFGTSSENPARLYDRNNNYLVFTPGQIADQFGRSIRMGGDENTGEDLVISDGVGGNDVVWRLKWKQITGVKKYKPYVVDLVVNCTSTFSCPPNTDPEYIQGAGGRVLDYLKLPSQAGNLQYTFSYNAYDSDEVPDPLVESVGMGELSGIEMPSGATISYEYALDNVSAQTGWLYTADALQNFITKKTIGYNAEYDDSSEPVSEVWSYGPGSVVGPDGAVTLDGSFQEGLWAGLSLSSVAPDGTKVERFWSANKPASGSPNTPMPNPYVDAEFTFIKSAGAYTHFSLKDFSYDKNGNVTEIKEYDWMPVSITIPRDGGTGPINGIPSGISGDLKRITKTAYYNDTPDASSTTYTDEQSYHLTTSPRLLRLPSSVEIQDVNQTPKSRSEFTYDYTSYSSNTKAGNVILTRAWDSTMNTVTNPLTDSNSIKTQATYNDYGMPLTTTDANNIVTQITYGNVAGPSGNVTNLYPTQTVAAYGTGLARTSSAVYDFWTGVVTSTTDEDNDVTNAMEYDDLGRPVKAISADGTSLESWTVTEYNDEERHVVVKSDLEALGDGKKVAIQHFDQLGRVRLSRTLEDAATEDPEDETDGIKVQTRYATTYSSPNGYTYSLTSNPYRTATSSAASSEPTMGWTRSKAWHTGIKQEVETFTGSSLPAPWGSNMTSTGKVVTDHDANVTTVTDQAGNPRRAVINAFGQLTRVDEPNSTNELGTISSPNQSTSYAHDVFNNLLSVSQGTQTRTFTYSSLSRMLTSQNPESGSVSNTFDSNGNLKTQRDARGIKTIFDYDALNRILEKCYRVIGPGSLGATTCATAGSEQAEPNTSDVSYTYDEISVPLSKGKLTKVENDNSSTQFTAFDIDGNVLSHKQTVDGRDYTTSYTYGISGALLSETYPSGRVVKRTYESDGALQQVLSKKDANHGVFKYAGQFTYAPSGRVVSMQLGNHAWQSVQLNARLQPTQIAAGTVPNGVDLWKMNYEFGELQTNGSVDTTKNNSNVGKQTVTVPTIGSVNGFTAVQAFTYDNLKRLKSATETIGSQTWKQTFNYDQHGNRTFDANNTTTIPSGCSTALCNPTIDPANNRFSSGQGYTFDDGGNVTQNADNAKFVYDGSNKIVEVRNATTNGLISKNYYDGDGVRVKVEESGVTTVFVYDAFDNLVAEYTVNAPENQDPKVNYLTTDMLGTPRVVTDENREIVSRRDMMPFGEEIAAGVGGRSTTHGYGGSNDVRQKFTGQQRDTVAKLDYFNARHYTFALGRFMSPDSFGGKIANPQTLNLYAYSLNNPLKWVDPSGHMPDDPPDYCNTCELDNNNYLYDDDGKLWKLGGEIVNVSGGEGETSTSDQTPAEPPPLPPSWQDWVPAWGALRQFAYNYNCRTGGCNVTRSTGAFVQLAAELTPVGSAVRAWSVARNAFIVDILAETRNVGQTGVRQYIVYKGVDPATQEVRYIGYTSRELVVREAEHVASGTEKATLIFSEVGRTSTKLQARTLEQNVMNQFGGKASMQSGKLYNKINSVAPKFWENYGIRPPG
jgi:RHS repeat-associated protein